MARYPSGLGVDFPPQTDDVRTWLARVSVAMDAQPIGTSAPCMNPECAGPVDYIGNGPSPLYCCSLRRWA